MTHTLAAADSPHTTPATSASPSPIGARRVRTDLKTSQNIFLTHCQCVPRMRSRTVSPATVSRQQQQQLQPQLQQHPHQLHQQAHLLPNNRHYHQQNWWQQHVDATYAQPQATRAYSRPMKVADAGERHMLGSGVMHPMYSSSAPNPISSSTYPSAHLPARATRLLNRSRLQQHLQQHPSAAQCPSMFGSATAADSDSSRSTHSLRRSQAASRASSASAASSNGHGHHASGRHQRAGSRQQQLAQLQQHRDSHSSSDDLMLYDKSFRNAMIQDVLQFKKQLLRLRRILQETETLNPFENDNGQLFANCGLDSKLLDDIDLASLTSSTTDDPIQELADIRRQVVYLQSQVDDRDRTIRLQRTLIERLEAEKIALSSTTNYGDLPKECINSATQTDRTRPALMAAEGLSRSKPEYTSYTTHFPLNSADSTTIIQHQPQQSLQPQQQSQLQSANNQTRRHTIISTTLSNYNQQFTAGSGGGVGASMGPRRASIAWESPKQQQVAAYKPVRITLIGEPLKQCNGEQKAYSNNNNNHNSKYANGCNGGSSNGTPIDIVAHDGGRRNDLLVRGGGKGTCSANKMYEEAKILEDGIQQVYQQLENNKKQQQHLRTNHRQENKVNLYPTVTIV